MKYHPQNDYMWDAWVVPHNEELHLFHLQTRISDGQPPEKGWGHAISRDLLHWEEKPAVLAATGTPQDRLYRYTGSTVRYKGLFYTFFVLRDGWGNQRIGVSTSEDLYHWNDHPDPVLEPDPALFLGYEPHGVDWMNVDCRDMLVIEAPEGGFYGYFVAVKADGDHRGVIGVAYSEDLLHWRDQRIAFTSPFVGVAEAMDIFPLNGRWVMTLLTAPNYGSRHALSDPALQRGEIFAVADSPVGPFVTDSADNVFIGGPNDSGFTCRTVDFKGQKRLIYLETNRGEGVLTLPKTVTMDDKGRPRVYYAADLLSSLRQEAISPHITAQPPCSFAWKIYGGKWQKNDGLLHIETAPNSWQAALFDGFGQNLEVCGHFSGDASAWGFVFYECAPDGTPNGFFFGDGRRVAVMAEPKLGKVSVVSLYDWTPLAVRHVSLDPEGFSLRVMKVDHTLDIYVNDELVLNAGVDMAEWTIPGCFADDGSVMLSDIGLWRLED